MSEINNPNKPFTCSRDIHNNRLNVIENNDFHLFSNKINVNPRPTSNICNNRTSYDNKDVTPQSLLIQARPISSHHNPTATFRNNYTKRDLSYCNIFDTQLNDTGKFFNLYKYSIVSSLVNKLLILVFSFS